jgi:hypothetical protein
MVVAPIWVLGTHRALLWALDARILAALLRPEASVLADVKHKTRADVVID